jgi:hypothetical protein
VVDDQMRADFATMGVSVPVTEETVENEFGVWDVAWPSFRAFLDCASQWRFVAGFGFVARLGLDWSAVDVLMRRRGLPDDVFEDLLVMEAAALSIFGEDGAR